MWTRRPLRLKNRAFFLIRSVAVKELQGCRCLQGESDLIRFSHKSHGNHMRNHMKQSVFTHRGHELARSSFARLIARKNLARGSEPARPYGGV